MSERSGQEHGLRYSDAGVDIDAGDAVVQGILEAARRTQTPNVLSGLGHFGGFFKIGPTSQGATLVASIDGVGTKLKLANLTGNRRGVGHDIVNHCTNDILACGARPLFFLDYFAAGKLDPEAAVTVISGIAEACEKLGIALLGGETAEMPGIYHGDDFDLAGVIIGMVDQESIINGSAVEAGDAIIGVPSDGFHTNGYSLIRTALKLDDDDVSRQRLAEPTAWNADLSLGDALLTPHRAYLGSISRALESRQITAMAHITGGGIPGNLSRVIPDGLQAQIDTSSWQTPPIMDYLAEVGNIAKDECYRVFNMGIGYIIVCRPEGVNQVLEAVSDGILIGTVAKSSATERVRLS